MFSMTASVPEPAYRIPFGQAAVRRRGTQATVVALGMMVPQVLRAASELAREGISVEVIDLRTVSPWDKQAVLESVSKTKRLVVADPAWKSFSVAAEIVAAVCEELGRELAANPVRFCLPDSHTPMSAPLEQEYYPTDAMLVSSIRSMVRDVPHGAQAATASKK